MACWDWLLAIPPRASADDTELGLHLAVSMFKKIGTPSDEIAGIVDEREQEIADVILGQFTLAESLRQPTHRPAAVEETSGAASTVAPPRPGARPANGKRQSKKRRKK